MLTKREREIAEMYYKGYSEQTIMSTLFIERSTLNTHKANIFRKMKVHSLSELLSLKIQELEIKNQYMKDYYM